MQGSSHIFDSKEKDSLLQAEKIWTCGTLEHEKLLHSEARSHGIVMANLPTENLKDQYQ